MEEWVGLGQAEGDGRKAGVDGEPLDASVAERVRDFQDGRGGGMSVADVERGARRLELANMIVNDWGPKQRRVTDVLDGVAGGASGVGGGWAGGEDQWGPGGGAGSVVFEGGRREFGLLVGVGSDLAVRKEILMGKL